MKKSKMVIQDGTIWATFKEGDLAELDNILAVPHPQAHWIRRKTGRKGWDGKQHFLQCQRRRYPAGLTCWVKEILGGRLEVLPDPRFTPIPESEVEATTDNCLDNITLYPYQLEAVKTVLRRGRGVLKAATNAGKTEIFIAVTKRIHACYKDPKTLYVVSRKDLLHQTHARYLQRWPGCRVGRLGDGISDLDCAVLVTTAQTLERRVKSKDPEVVGFMQRAVSLILDECHHSKSKSWLKIARQCYAPYRIGGSGTPLTRDVLANVDVIGCTGDIIFDITNKYLIDEGYSAKPTMHIVEMDAYNRCLKDIPYDPLEKTPCLVWKPRIRELVPGTFNEREKRPVMKKGIVVEKDGETVMKSTGKSWVQLKPDEGADLVASEYLATESAYDSGIVTFEPRNRSIVRYCKLFAAEEKPTLVIISKTIHGHILDRMISDAGLKCRFVWGKSASKARKQARDDLSSGKLQVLVASMIFDEGVDVPAIKALIMTAGGKSLIQTLQRVGRGLRRKEGDNRLDVVDFMDYQHPYLLKHSLQRIGDYQGEKFPAIAETGDIS